MRLRSRQRQRDRAAAAAVVQRDRARREVDDRSGGRQPRQSEDDVVAVELRHEQPLRRAARRSVEKRECDWRLDDTRRRSELTVVAAHEMLCREHVLFQAVSSEEVDCHEVARRAAVDETADAMPVYGRVDAEENASVRPGRSIGYGENVMRRLMRRRSRHSLRQE